MLILLALRQDHRLIIPLSIFAILPDLDALIGIHRATFHNIFVLVLIPLIFILIVRMKRPNLVLPGLIVLFYLVSHLVLDMGGVALLYPFYDQAFYLQPALHFQTGPVLDFDFVIDYGTMELSQTGEYLFVSELGFAYLFLFVLVTVLFRKEVVRGARQVIDNISKNIKRLMKK